MDVLSIRMRFRLALTLCAALLSIACSDDTLLHANATAVATHAGTGSAQRTWTITPDGIGSLRLGEKLVEPKEGFENTYRTSFYGDAQPLEGFMFDQPPVLAVFTGGPFSVWGARHVGKAPPEPIQTRAIALASADRFEIEMLVITDKRPKTAAGISVGDNYAEFARAYPRAPAPEAFTGLWEQPSCMVSRETIWFFFDRCDNADEAKIIRIAVRAHGSQV
jgi:hypothetical protein